MTDSYGREVAYMRVSVTDRCNLRCRYCMPEDIPSVGHDAVLRYEELLRVCKAAVSCGVRHFRVTGGEPLVRKDCMSFLRGLTELPGAETVSLTTNGVLLEPHIPEFAAMGIAGVNISLDTLRPDRYRILTGQDQLPAVRRSMAAALAAGLPVRVNCVPLDGFNRDELPAIAALAARDPVDVRFIELMPTQRGEPRTPIPGEAVRDILREEYPDLHPVDERPGHGPARYWRSERLRGRIGFIDPLSHHFCESCNRLRLTAEGFLRLCLFHGAGVSLRDLLRAGGVDGELESAIRTAVQSKPERHHWGEPCSQRGIETMSSIGG